MYLEAMAKQDDVSETGYPNPLNAHTREFYQMAANYMLVHSYRIRKFMPCLWYRSRETCMVQSAIMRFKSCLTARKKIIYHVYSGQCIPGEHDRGD